VDVDEALALELVLVVVGSTVELADEDGVMMLVLLKTGVEDTDEMMEELGSSSQYVPSQLSSPSSVETELKAAANGSKYAAIRVKETIMKYVRIPKTTKLEDFFLRRVET
jgi:hypothetical protein